MKEVAPSRIVIEQPGFVDELSVMAYDQLQRGYPLMVWREYKRISEKIDLAHPAPWVRFRHALQGPE